MRSETIATLRHLAGTADARTPITMKLHIASLVMVVASVAGSAGADTARSQTGRPDPERVDTPRPPAARSEEVPLPDEPARWLPDPIAVVRFATGSTSLDPSHRRLLVRAVQWLDDNPQRLLLVEAHADRIGSRDANLTLSQRRAEVVHDELIRLGADPFRLVGAAYGEAEATQDNAASRRVEVRGTLHAFPELVRGQHNERFDRAPAPTDPEPVR